MKLSPVFTSIALALTCSSTSVLAKDFIPIETFPEWFKTAMSRSIDVTKESDFSLASVAAKGKVKGEISLVDESEGTWYYHIDIGTPTPVECYVFNEYDGPANSLHAIVDLSLNGAAELNGKTRSAQFNYAIDTGVIGNTPYLQLDTLYHLGEGEEKVAGMIKAYSAQTNDTLEICVHNELGYRDIFFDVFSSFVNSFNSEPADAPFFESVYEMRINDIPMGFAVEKYTKDADGDVMIESETALLVPVDANTVSRTDSADISWSRPDGSLINGSTYTIDNGVLSSEFEISVADDKWHVEGQIQGKAVSADLAYDGWLLSDFGSYLETADLIKSDAESAQFKMWTPDADPVSAISITLSKVTGNEDANMKIDMGPMVLDFYAEDNGIFKHGVMAQGPINIFMKSIYTQGVPSL